MVVRHCAVWVTDGLVSYGEIRLRFSGESSSVVSVQLCAVKCYIVPVR